MIEIVEKKDGDYQLLFLSKNQIKKQGSTLFCRLVGLIHLRSVIVLVKINHQKLKKSLIKSKRFGYLSYLFSFIITSLKTVCMKFHSDAK